MPAPAAARRLPGVAARSLAIYRSFLRHARTLPPAERAALAARARSEFAAAASASLDVAEHLQRRAGRQLALLRGGGRFTGVV